METSKLITKLSDSSIGAYSELVSGDSSINLTLAEFRGKKLIDLPYSSKDMISYLWNPYVTNGPVFSVDDVSVLNDPSTLFVGPPFSHPFKDLRDMKWKLSNSRDTGVISTKYVDKPLFIYDNDLKFYNVFDTSSDFILSNTRNTILLEKAFLRDNNNDDWENSVIYSVYPDASDGKYVLECSTGITYFDGYLVLQPGIASFLRYGDHPLYNVPLLTMKGFEYTDPSGTIKSLSETYILDILDGKIGFYDPSNNITEYINFNYDASIVEQSITHDVTYESDRFPIYQIDPSIYYSKQVPDASVLMIDNSVYTMNVHNMGNYQIEVQGWDSFNNIYWNNSNLEHKVWVKSPTVYSITNRAQSTTNPASYSVSALDVSLYLSQNSRPIYDRIFPLSGITLEYEDSSMYIRIPSITYFQDVPDPGSMNRFYDLTERVLDISVNELTIDPDFQSFYVNDSVNIVKFDKGNHEYVMDVDVSITSKTGNVIGVSSIPPTFVIDSSNDVYVKNTTFRSTSNPLNYYDSSTSRIQISGYDFLPNQLLNLIVKDNITSYSWGASYRVLDVSGGFHYLDDLIPEQFTNDNARYTITAKHGFTTYAATDMTTKSAVEIDNYWKLYLNDTYNEEWFLDSTFSVINILFDKNLVDSHWGIGTDFDGYSAYYKPITVDTSSMILLTATFDPSNYMIGQRNIWTVRYNDTKDVLLRVHNLIVPYTFSKKGYYDVQVECYDTYGNLSSINCEGLINVV